MRFPTCRGRRKDVPCPEHRHAKQGKDTVLHPREGQLMLALENGGALEGSRFLVASERRILRRGRQATGEGPPNAIHDVFLSCYLGRC